jgi:VWFA-related protein
MRSSFRFSALTLLIGALPLGAQQDSGPQVFTEVIDVRVVNVETVVTDGDGNLVRGLAPEDFLLRVDGKEVPVEYFSEIAEGTAAAAGAEGISSQVEKGAEVGRSYLVFVDEAFALASTRNEVLERMERDLALMGPQDRMAVLAFDGQKIEVLCPWSGDRAALAAALRKARSRPVKGHQLKAQERSMTTLDYEFLYMVAESTEIDVEQERSYMDNRVSPEVRGQLGKASQAVAAALRAFEVPPGRKAVLLLSAGWSMAAGPHLFGPVIEAANRLGYTVYPVDVAASNAQAVKLLDAIAIRTGGKVASTARMDVLRQVAADTASYYWLGFTPTWKGDGGQHRVTVEVRRAGLQTRARSTFTDVSRHVEARMRAESALLFGAPEEEKRLIVQLGEPKRAGRKQIEVPVTLGVPVSSLALTPDGDGYIAETPLAVAAVDEKGGRSELPSSKLRVKVKQVPKGGGYARFQTVVKLRDVEQRLVFTVPDPVSGSIIWGEANVRRAGPKQR